MVGHSVNRLVKPYFLIVYWEINGASVKMSCQMLHSLCTANNRPSDAFSCKCWKQQVRPHTISLNCHFALEFQLIALTWTFCSANQKSLVQRVNCWGTRTQRSVTSITSWKSRWADELLQQHIFPPSVPWSSNAKYQGSGWQWDDTLMTSIKKVFNSHLLPYELLHFSRMPFVARLATSFISSW